MKLVKFTFFLGALFVLIANTGMGQTYSETFDEAGNWSGSYSSYAGDANYSNNSADPTGDSFVFGTALRGTNAHSGSYAIRLDDLTTSYFLYQSATDLGIQGFSIWLAHWDVSDAMEVYIEYSTDGGSTFTNITTLDETWWTGDGLGDKGYKQYSSGSLNISPESGKAIQFKIRTNGNERLLLDDFEVTEMITNSNDTDTEVYQQVAQPTAGGLSSVSNDEADEAKAVFNFRIEDQATADGLATDVTNIRIFPGATNTADWTDHIQGVKLSNGSEITIGTPTISDSYIDIPVSSSLTIADGGSEDLTLSVYLNPTNLVDGAVLSFMIDADSHGFTADAAGSGFASTFMLDDVLSNDFTVEVEATQLSFQTQPSNATIGLAMSPSVEVIYSDVNGNIDADYDGNSYTISLSTTGTLDGAATTTVAATQGVATFDNLIFSATGTGLTLTASDASGMGNTGVTSNTFSTAEASKLLISKVADPSTWQKRFVELYNAGSSAINLEEESWYLAKQTNGGSFNSVALTGTIGAGETYVVAYSETEFNSAFGFNPDQVNGTVINGNGDDGFYLYKGGDESTGTLVDAYGIMDEDGSGKAWEYENSIAVRNATQANSTWTDSEWTITAGDFDAMTPAAHGDFMLWIGGTDTDWTNAANWSGSGAPGSASILRLKSGASTYPSLASLSIGTDADKVIIEGGAVLTVVGAVTNTTAANLVLQHSTTASAQLVMGSGSPKVQVEKEIAFTKPTPFCIGVDATDAASVSIPGNFYVQEWIENDPTDSQTWPDMWFDASGSLSASKGYIAYANEAANVTLTLAGTASNTDLNLSDLSMTTGKGEGWHFLPNPYTHAMLWDNLSFTNVQANALHVYSPSADNYLTVDGTGETVDPNTAYFIRVTDASNSFSTSASKKNYVEQEVLKLRIDGGSSYDVAKVKMIASAKAGFETAFDANKMFGAATAVQMFSTVDGQKLSINSLPADFEGAVPMTIRMGESGSATLSFEKQNWFEGNAVSIKIGEELQDVTEDFSHTFTAEAGTDVSFDLYINKKAMDIKEASDNLVNVSSQEKQLFVKLAQELLNADITVFNTLGAKVYEAKAVKELNTISLESKGVYMLRVRKGANIIIKKAMLR